MFYIKMIFLTYKVHSDNVINNLTINDAPEYLLISLSPVSPVWWLVNAGRNLVPCYSTRQRKPTDGRGAVNPWARDGGSATRRPGTFTNLRQCRAARPHAHLYDHNAGYIFRYELMAKRWCDVLYSTSKKFWPLSCSNLIYYMSQDFLGIPYVQVLTHFM